MTEIYQIAIRNATTPSHEAYRVLLLFNLVITEIPGTASSSTGFEWKTKAALDPLRDNP